MTTTKTTCRHLETRTLQTTGYRGPVSIHDENPAAHGWICLEVECVTCGARRLENVNGRHEELGAWGPDRAERRAHASRLDARRWEIRMGRPEPVVVTAADGREIEVRVDDDGTLVCRGLHGARFAESEERDIIEASGLLAYASGLRSATIEAANARSAV